MITPELMKINRHARVAVPSKREVYEQFGMHPLQGVKQKNDKFGKPVNLFRPMSELDMLALGDSAYRSEVLDYIKQRYDEAQALNKPDEKPEDGTTTTTTTEV